MGLLAAQNQGSGPFDKNAAKIAEFFSMPYATPANDVRE
jgi:hypothetical protein